MLLNKELFIVYGLSVLLVTSLKSPVWALQTISEMSRPLSYSPFVESLVMLLILSVMLLWTASTMGQHLLSMIYPSISLFIIIWLCFRANSSMLFYSMFEASLIPIFLIVMGWGYQPERLTAGVSMLLYTILGSLPLLIMFLFMWKTNGVAYFSHSTALPCSSNQYLGTTLMIFLTLGFLIKIPMFSVHLWLPKAHVEAPMAGSMVLAAVLLKLGGFGLVRVSPFLYSFSGMEGVIMALSLTGGVYMSFLCIGQLDMKVMIAYSSVAHMSMVIYSLISGSPLGLWASMSMILAHGPSSSGLFMAANILYLRSGTRLILLNKGTINHLPVMTIFMFMLCAANMGAPPSFNLISEISNFVVMINLNTLSSGPVALMALLAVAYSLVLYSFTQQGLTPGSSGMIAPLSVADTLSLSSHAFFSVAPVLSICLILI